MTKVPLGRVGDDLATLFRAGADGPKTDAELLRQFVEGRGDPGSESAFATLVARHGPTVLGACRRVLGDVHAADDAFQATFLVLARQAARVGNDVALGGWLYRVAVRVALRARRSARRLGAIEGVEPTASGVTLGPLERAELLAAIDAEIARLPARYRAAVVLCHVEGLDGPTAARRLRLPLGTLQSRLHRARNQLRRGLARRGLAPAGLGAALAAAGASARGAVPSPLARITARLAIGGMVPAGVGRLIPALVGRLVVKKAAGIAGVVIGVVGFGGGSGLAPRGVDAGARPATEPAGPSVGDQIRAEMAAFREYEARREAIGFFATSEQMDKRFQDYAARLVESSKKLLALIEQEPSDPAALDAMLWHVSMYWITAPNGPINDQLRRSVETLLLHYADEPRVAWRVLVGRNGMPTRLDDRLLPGLVEGSRRRETKGLALLALGRYTEEKAGCILRLQKEKGPFYLDVVWGGKSKTRPFDDAYEAELRAADAAAVRRQADGYFSRIVAEFADVMKVRNDPADPKFMTWVTPRAIGDEAAEHLAGLRGVAIGKPAPDVTWSHDDGSTARLADFRGKVVVLGFWQDGQHRSGQELARQTRLARRMQGRPFALIAFSRSDPESPGQGRFSLPYSRPDGRAATALDGPIRERFGVRLFPTTIIIDAEGIVRFQCGASVWLDGYVESLVKEAEARVAKR